jgi:hypothetical protein
MRLSSGAHPVVKRYVIESRLVDRVIDPTDIDTSNAAGGCVGGQ